MMKKILLVINCLFLVICLSGCASLKRLTHPFGGGNKNPATESLPAYSGPKAKVVVADFEIKAAKATNEIAASMREMFVAALKNSNRFFLLERQELKTASPEQPGPLQALIITAEVTEFEPQASGGVSGIGGGGGAGSGVLGGLLGNSLNKAHVTLNIRIVDAGTSEVIASTQIQGQATDVAAGAVGGTGNWELAGSLNIYANTPMEKAIKTSIIEAVRYLVLGVPTNYYKY